jgi:hypothetical protein
MPNATVRANARTMPKSAPKAADVALPFKPLVGSRIATARFGLRDAADELRRASNLVEAAKMATRDFDRSAQAIAMTTLLAAIDERLTAASKKIDDVRTLPEALANV